MDYPLTLKKLIASQNLYAGVRTTAAALIPAIILYHYNVLGLMIAIPLGALVVSSTDSPGPFRLRRNTVLASICINFLVVVITISLQHNPVLIALAIIVFGMFFSLIGIYGNRANSVGLIALLVFILNIDSKASFGSVWFNGLLFTAGGAWYFALSLILHRLRPYRQIQLQLGESLRTIALYMQTLSGLFKTNSDNDYLYNRLTQQQVTIQQQQDALRETLLSAREMVIDTTVRGRILMMMFLDSIDLFEQILSLQQDYTSFNNSKLIPAIHETLLNLQQELNAIGYAIQFNQPSKPHNDINKVMQNLFNIFLEERKTNLNKNTLPSFIKLRQIIFALQDVGERIKRLHHFTGYDKMASKQYKKNLNAEPLTKSTELSPELFVENLSLQSSQFRHALRTTIGMLIGFAVSLFLPVGHGYWIMMTVSIILKPAYSITKTRNKQRVLGTLTGVIIGFTFLYFVSNNTLAFLLMLCAMIVAYSLLKVNYYISVVCITIYVLLSIHFLNNSNFNAVIEDRLIDTVIGCAIAFIISSTVFPVWEHEQTKDLITKIVTANKKYFNAVAATFKAKNNIDILYKQARKDAFVALANLSDNFQRILSEKKNKEDKLAFYHQFVSSSYMLTVHIASLASLLKRSDNNIVNETDFSPLIHNVDDKFKRAECLLEGKPVKSIVSNRNAPITNKIQALLQQREKEIEEGESEQQTTARKMLNSIKTITDELEMIDSIVNDEVKILKKLQ